MGAQVRVLRRRIRSVQSTKKITKAMELIAASRIVKAQHRVAAATPYTAELTKVLTALSGNATVDHPLLTPRETVRRAGVVVITSDRGLAGAYNANVLRAAEQLMDRLAARQIDSELFVVGRKGANYYRFRGRGLAAGWSGFSEQPSYADAQRISQTLVPSFLAGSHRSVDKTARNADGGVSVGVDELHLVYTHFRNMLNQEPVTYRCAPMEIPADAQPDPAQLRAAYEFEPGASALLDSLLPNYVTAVVHSALLESAASESAARRRAMKAATDNAQDLIRSLTREANQARQADITQEISEIVGGADALAATGSDE
ncbi:MAG: F0F1 ATP synthase subunit gamma [Acidimicrobiales bacterium]|nr:MAG: F0F1 ATP synthase subunit gamma [Acidimicrobiales bacterium]